MEQVIAAWELLKSVVVAKILEANGAASYSVFPHADAVGNHFDLLVVC